MNQNNRTEKRRHLQKECILDNEFGLIEAQTIDISKTGLGVKIDGTFPLKFKNGGCELGVFIPNKKLSQAKLMWIKKDFNNTTRLGLKLLLS